MWPFQRKLDASESSPAVPPVDLDAPVTNPGLLAALNAFAADQSEDHLDGLLTELNQAVYLVATLLDEANVQETDTPGDIVFKKGSVIQVIAAADDDGNSLLPLFTDWDAIKLWTQDPVQTLVMPAADAWSFALGDYNGVIINPAGPSLPLNRPQVEELHRCLKSA